jgi:hypothetical protein
MRSTRPKQVAPLHVAIVSKSPDTLGGLAAYLQDAGATTVGTHEVENSVLLGAGAAAIVAFPDDFDWEAGVAALSACLRTHPHALLVLVTNAPQRFAAVSWPDRGVTPLVMPKPAWGWTILDAIRAHLSGPSS